MAVFVLHGAPVHINSDGLTDVGERMSGRSRYVVDRTSIASLELRQRMFRLGLVQIGTSWREGKRLSDARN